MRSSEASRFESRPAGIKSKVSLPRLMVGDATAVVTAATGCVSPCLYHGTFSIQQGCKLGFGFSQSGASFVVTTLGTAVPNIIRTVAVTCSKKDKL